MLYNILYIDHAGKLGGAELSLLRLIAKLDKHRYNLFVIVGEKGPFFENLKSLGVQVSSIRMSKLRKTLNPIKLILYLISFLLVVPRIFWKIKGDKINLIHTNSSPAHLYGGIASLLARVPILWHLRDFTKIKWIRKLYLWFNRNNLIYIVANSKAVKNAFMSNVEDKQFNNQICVNYSGIEVEKYKLDYSNKLRNELNIPLDRKIVGIVGQLYLHKGQHLFIKAAHLVLQNIGNVTFLVVGSVLFGDASYERALRESAIKLGISNKILFLGQRDDIPEIMNLLDILVMASQKEPLGLVTMEAMAGGKPVIATRTGGTIEIVEDKKTGLLIPPNNPQSIAEGIVYLINNPEIAEKMGKEGRKRIEKNFNIQVHVKNMLSLYKWFIRFSCGKDNGAEWRDKL